jgi:hypothetical protein
MKPDISYELNIDQNNPEVVSAFESITSTTKNNEAELNKQVIGVINVSSDFSHLHLQVFLRIRIQIMQ